MIIICFYSELRFHSNWPPFCPSETEVWSCFYPLLMWRFNYGANWLLDFIFVICRPLICTNWIYIVWECSFFFNLPLNHQISACSWSVHFIQFRSFKPPQSFLVTVGRSKPPQPFHPLLNWSTSLRLSERGLWGKIKWHCLPLTWLSKPKCAILKLKHIALELRGAGFIH